MMGLGRCANPQGALRAGAPYGSYGRRTRRFIESFFYGGGLSYDPNHNRFLVGNVCARAVDLSSTPLQLPPRAAPIFWRTKMKGESAGIFPI
jgi:hypothetical protein